MKKWIKLLLIILIFALFSVSTFFILKHFNLTNPNKLKYLISSTGKYGIFAFFLLEVFTFVILCFIPAAELTLTIIGIYLFGAKTTFFTSWFAEIVGDSIMYFLGYKFGNKLASKLIKKDELEYAQALVNCKSKTMLPVFFLIPGFPDDIISLIAGLSKIKFWYFALNSFVFCGIDCAIICFLGSGIIPWATLSIFDWIVFANILIIDIYLLKKLQKFLENKAKNDKN